MSHTNSVIKGEFYSLAQGTKSKELPSEGKIYSYYSEDDIFQRILPIIPKVCGNVLVQYKMDKV